MIEGVAHPTAQDLRKASICSACIAFGIQEKRSVTHHLHYIVVVLRKSWFCHISLNSAASEVVDLLSAMNPFKKILWRFTRLMLRQVKRVILAPSYLFKISKPRCKWGTLILILLAVFCTYHLINLPSIQPSSALNRSDPLDENIRNLRTDDLIIKIINSNQQPVVDAAVKLEQTAHHFGFGTALSTQMFSNTANRVEQAQYFKLIKELFNTSVHENALKWYSTEPVRGQVSYADADRILNWSESNGLKMRGHTLFWEPEQWNQDWLKGLNNEELRLAVQKRATEICTRYRGRIAEYDVLNEMLHGDFFQKRLGEKIVDDMFRWCREADPSARLYVNDYNILNGQDLDKYASQIRSLINRGVPVGGIGAQGHIREKISAERVQQSLDTLAQFGLPIKITEFDAIADTEEEKARILKDVYRVAFAHPAVTGILMWGFWEGAHWEPKAALFKKNWEPLSAAQAYRELVYQDWWTKIDAFTNRVGEVKTRAFFGNYRLTVGAGNWTTQQSFSFVPGEKLPRVITIVAEKTN